MTHVSILLQLAARTLQLSGHLVAYSGRRNGGLENGGRGTGKWGMGEEPVTHNRQTSISSGLYGFGYRVSGRRRSR